VSGVCEGAKGIDGRAATVKRECKEGKERIKKKERLEILLQINLLEINFT